MSHIVRQLAPSCSELAARLDKMPNGGRTAITEECFTNNVLEFATNFTMIKGMDENGEGKWEKFEQNDLSEGTYPAGSVWRPVGKYLKTAATLRKDSVVVPATLVPGDYVLSAISANFCSWVCKTN